jgi:hypothetical protein
MSEFFKTGMGAKFYNADVPSLIKQLKRIADELAKFNVIDEPEETTGAFENLTDKEKAELDEEMKTFDQFFDKLMKNFEIDKVVDEVIDSFSYESLKNLVRHAWNANK